MVTVNTGGSRRFENKIAVVTGAAQGLGRATALRLAAEGAKVVIGDRVREQADKVKDELHALGADCRVVMADMETWKGAEHLMAEAHAAYDGSTSASTTWAAPSGRCRITI